MRSVRRPRAVLWLPLLAQTAAALNILVYSPRFGASHSTFMSTISDVLAEAGHNVVYLEPLFVRNVSARGPQKATVIELAQSRFIQELIAAQASDSSGAARWKIELLPNPKVLHNFMLYLRVCGKDAVQKIFDDDELMSRLKSYNFDIGISQPNEYGGFSLFYRLNLRNYVTVFSTSPYALLQLFGAQSAMSYVPALSTHNSDVMSLLQRTLNAIYGLLEIPIFDSGFEEFDQLFAADPDFSGMREFVAKSSYLIVNVDPIFDFPRPLISKIILVGGISVPGVNETEPLPEELSKVLDLRPSSVFISFGSMAKSADMPLEFKQALIAAMSRLPNTTFIWKFENPRDPVLAALPNNVYTTAWAPQLALLRDARLTAFVTHSGAGSLNEVAASGKKVMCVPLFADQYNNARQLERVGMATIYGSRYLSDARKLYEALAHLISSEELASSARAVAAMIRERPFQPKDVFTRHVEFAAKFGPLHQLDPVGRQLSLVQHLYLDCLCLGLAAILLVAFVAAHLVKALRRIALTKSSKTKAA